jgi:tRNA pseudouridine38-40 synthase
MNTLILKLEYDGTNYAGWQIQPNAKTIQEELEHAIKKIVGFPLKTVGAGRTDAGVHAKGQVVSIPLSIDFPVPIQKIPQAFNSNLPSDIKVKSAVTLPYSFNARFDALAREYSYTLLLKDSVFLKRFALVIKYDLDLALLEESAKLFIGKNNFTTFSKLNEETKHHFCNVMISEWQKIGEDILQYRIKADRFLYGMVRALVGAMIDVARGKRKIDDIKKALKNKERSQASPLVQPQGLVLEKVYYSKKLFLE